MFPVGYGCSRLKSKSKDGKTSNRNTQAITTLCRDISAVPSDVDLVGCLLSFLTTKVVGTTSSDGFIVCL